MTAMVSHYIHILRAKATKTTATKQQSNKKKEKEQSPAGFQLAVLHPKNCAGLLPKPQFLICVR